MNGSAVEARLLITGGSGFVGGALADLLAADYPQCTVHLVGHRVGGFDICDDASVSELVNRIRPTAVVHLAAIASPLEAKEEPRRAWDVNLIGTLNVAGAIRRHVPDARLIFAGSAESYGSSFREANGRPVPERSPLLPETVYAATKASADLMLAQMARDGLNVVRFRPFNHTGPGQTDKFVVPSFARQIANIAKGQHPNIIEVGNIDVARDFIDVRDVVRAYAKAALELECPGVGKVYNLSSGKPRTIRSILEMLIEFSGVELEVRIAQSKLRPDEVLVVCGDAEAAWNDLGWAPVIPMEQTVADVFNYWIGEVSNR